MGRGWGCVLTPDMIPKLALKYVRKLIERYSEDGLLVSALPS